MIQGVDLYGNVSTKDWFGRDLLKNHGDTKMGTKAFEDLMSTKFGYLFSSSPTGPKKTNFDYFE